MAFKSAADMARQLFAQFQQKAVPTVKSAVGSFIQRGMVTPQNVIHSTTPNPLGQKVFKAIGNFNPANAIPFTTQPVRQMIKPYVPTVGQYVQGQILNPIRQGVKTAINPTQTPVNRVLGGVQAAFGGFGATPIGVGYNVGYGAAAGALKALRTKGNIAQNIRQGIANPSDIGGTGLGIKNPLLATGIDIVTGNPRSALKAKNLVQGLKGVSPNAFKVHPQDEKTLNILMDKIFTKSKLDQTDNNNIQSLASHYLGGDYKGANNRTIALAFQSILGKKRGGIVGDVPPAYKMGLVSNRKDKDILKNSLAENLPQTKGIMQSQMPQINKSGIVENAGVGIVSASGKGSSGKSIAQIPNSENPYFNTNRINAKPEAKQLINKTIQEVKPAIEKVVGKKLSNNEIIATANNSAKVLRRAVDRQQTSDFETALLKTRQKLAAMSDSGTVDKDYLDTLITLKSHATDIGRKLQSFSINADPKNVTAKNAIMEAVTRVEKDSNKILEAAKGVDFNDYKQATEFYRKFVKPTTSEWIDTLRYNSMLSSPNTHINNAFSNLVNTSLVAPIEKTITGAVDFLKSATTGKERQAFAGEGLAYAGSYAKNLNEASHRFAEVMRGNRVFTNLDTRSIPLAQKGIAGATEKGLSFFTRLLEGSDQFFTTLTSGGEKAALQLRKARGVNVGNIETKAAENAAYRLFRSELGNEKQGHLLDGIDKFTGLVQQARSSDNAIVSTLAKFTLPFVRTPMNILKQGIEYSPAGVLTLPGAKNKTEQISKIILGSSAAAATAMLAASGRTTWALPTDEKAKQAFYAAGMQPYSIKIGDKWVSYAKLPPAISFNIALISAIHDAQEKKQLDDGQVETILDGVAKWGNFFADQSYLKNIGDFVAAAKGDKTAVNQAISNYPQQLIPFRAMSGWIARTLDPYLRKVDPGEDFLHKQIDLVKTQIPGLSQQVTPRLDERGNPIPNNNRFINAVSPARITTESVEGKKRYDIRNTELSANAYLLPLKQDIQSQTDDITSKVTTDIFNKIVADRPDLDQQTQNKLYERLHSKISTKTKRAILVKNADKIKDLLVNIPKDDPQKLRIYLEKLKSSGLLTKDTAQAIGGSQ